MAEVFPEEAFPAAGDLPGAFPVEEAADVPVALAAGDPAADLALDRDPAASGPASAVSGQGPTLFITHHGMAETAAQTAVETAMAERTAAAERCF